MERYPLARIADSGGGMRLRPCPSPAAELARRLARDAEAVCRHYLSNGRRQGRYWMVGDVANTPGRSLYRPARPGPRAARAPPANGPTPPPASMAISSISSPSNRRLDRLRDVLDEARCLPQPAATRAGPFRTDDRQRRRGSPESARRLFAMSQPIPGTIAEAYLRAAALRLCTGPEPCASTRAATIGRMTTPRPRSGRR